MVGRKPTAFFLAPLLNQQSPRAGQLPLRMGQTTWALSAWGSVGRGGDGSLCWAGGSQQRLWLSGRFLGVLPLRRGARLVASGPGVLELCGVGPGLRGPLPPMAPSLILRGGLPPCHASPTTTSHISSILPLSSEGTHGGSQALLLPSTVPQEMSPCSRNVGAPAPEVGCPCRCPRLLEAALCLPCPPLGPASLPCFCPLLPSQGWTGRDVIRQECWSASAVSSAVRRCSGSLPLCPPPLSGEGTPDFRGGLPWHPLPLPPRPPRGGPLLGGGAPAAALSLPAPMGLSPCCPPRTQMRPRVLPAQLPSQSSRHQDDAHSHTQHHQPHHPDLPFTWERPQQLACKLQVWVLFSASMPLLELAFHEGGSCRLFPLLIEPKGLAILTSQFWDLSVRWIGTGLSPASPLL